MTRWTACRDVALISGALHAVRGPGVAVPPGTDLTHDFPRSGKGAGRPPGYVCTQSSTGNEVIMKAQRNGTTVAGRGTATGTLTASARLAALVGALVLVVSGCGAGGATTADRDASPIGSSSGGSADGSPAALDFTSETVAGEAFDGATLAGRPTVFWFWAPWCPTCRAQISGVGELAEAYGADVNIVGVGSLDEREAIEGFAAEVSPDVTLLADPDGAVWRQFGVTAQSTYLVLDENGNEQASGYLDDAELAALVDDLAG